jgi:hypothetical protein
MQPIKKQIKCLRTCFQNWKTVQYVKNLETSFLPKTPNDFDCLLFKSKILAFLNSVLVDKSSRRYLYSSSCKKPTLYSSAYACMTLSMLGELKDLPKSQKQQWADYFNSFQNPDDGLFYDPVVMNDIYSDADWWGARHLALHMISAFTDLGDKPKYPFRFLKKYYTHGAINNWLDSFDWSKSVPHDNDIDNQIMNIGCLLQYQRDFWNDEQAGKVVAYLQEYLMNKINSETGMWGRGDIQNPDQRSRIVQFAYHLFPLFFYDQIPIQHPDKIVKIVLTTQNKLGGFGVKFNSSACEDIDSIDLLIRLHKFVSPNLQSQTHSALERAFSWVLINQVDDGGFVFKLGEPFMYGAEQTSSKANEGATLPTWFRTLSLAYMARFFDIENKFNIIKSPGYEFP